MNFLNTLNSNSKLYLFGALMSFSLVFLSLVIVLLSNYFKLDAVVVAGDPVFATVVLFFVAVVCPALIWGMLFVPVTFTGANKVFTILAEVVVILIAVYFLTPMADSVLGNVENKEVVVFSQDITYDSSAKSINILTKEGVISISSQEKVNKLLAALPYGAKINYTVATTEGGNQIVFPTSDRYIKVAPNL